MKQIDAHVHLTDRICGFGPGGEVRPQGNGIVRTAQGIKTALIPPQLGSKEFTAETYMSLMDECGVQKAVLLQAGFYGYVNEYLHEVVQKYPDRFAAAGGYDPCCRASREVFRRLSGELGFRIFKFEMSSMGGIEGCHPGLLLDDAPMEQACSDMEALGATLAIDLGQPGMESYQPQAMCRVAKRHPGLHLVLCHLLVGRQLAWDTWKEVLSLFAGLPNVWFDLAALPPNLGDMVPPHEKALHAIATAKDIVGAEHLVWGSDVPSVLLDGEYALTWAYITQSGLFTEVEQALVFCENAKRAYRL